MKKYTGVRFNKISAKWQAAVTHQGTVYNCGQHATPELAAKARDVKIIENRLPQSLQILKPKK